MAKCGAKLSDGSICDEETVWNGLCELCNDAYESELYDQPYDAYRIKRIVDDGNFTLKFLVEFDAIVEYLDRRGDVVYATPINSFDQLFDIVGNEFTIQGS